MHQAVERLSDEELALRVARREASAGAWDDATHCFEVLYRRYAVRLVSFLAARVNRADLEDVHQVVWQRVWQYLPTQFRAENFRAWLHQIARNYLIDLSRRRQADRLTQAESLDHIAARRVDDPLVQREQRELLEECIRRLDGEAAELVRARLRGESYDEICVRLDMPPSRAHKLFHMAKARLTEYLSRAMR